MLPISYGDAQPLLAAITGPMAPETWRGGLPITYHIGRGAGQSASRGKANWDMKTIYDVIAKFPAATSRAVGMRGNHHDAWVNGAEDPFPAGRGAGRGARAGRDAEAGMASQAHHHLLCVGRRRAGLLGSTEWVEPQQENSASTLSLYFNTDSNEPRLSRHHRHQHPEHTASTAWLATFRIPEPHISVWEREIFLDISRAKSPKRTARRFASRRPARGLAGFRQRLHCFLDHLGVASADLGFGGEDDGGIYHSIYDDFYWYTHFADTDFLYGRALSQTVGTTVMRFADADLLPFDPSGSADTVKRYIAELKKELKKKQDEIHERNRQVEEGVFTATADPDKQYVPPTKQPMPPYLNFAPLENGAEAYARAAQRYRQAVARLNENANAWQSPALKEINAKLLLTERTFTVNQGLKERPWFKHQIYAPGAYTGYGAKPIPAVREAIEEDKWQDADQGAVLVGQVLLNEASLVDSIAQELEQAEGQPPSAQTAQESRSHTSAQKNSSGK